MKSVYLFEVDIYLTQMNDATHIPMRPILTSEARAVAEAAALAEAVVGNPCPAPFGATTAEPVTATPLRTVSCFRNRARFRKNEDEGDQGVGHHATVVPDTDVIARE